MDILGVHSVHIDEIRNKECTTDRGNSCVRHRELLMEVTVAGDKKWTCARGRLTVRSCGQTTMFALMRIRERLRASNETTR